MYKVMRRASCIKCWLVHAMDSAYKLWFTIYFLSDRVVALSEIIKTHFYDTYISFNERRFYFFLISQ